MPLVELEVAGDDDNLLLIYPHGQSLHLVKLEDGWRVRSIGAEETSTVDEGASVWLIPNPHEEAWANVG